MEIINLLDKEYGGLGCALVYETPFELLIATMLSAQTTDITVNKATTVLFQKYNKPEEFAVLELSELEGYIKTCGFYKTKGIHIIDTSKKLITEFGGEVPRTIEELTSLPGVGRKTANVVMSNAFGIAAIAVDTHVFRVSNRIGLANSNSVEDTEKQLMEKIPKDYWSSTHHLLIWHGRRICTARKPKCEHCSIANLCRFYINQISN